MIACLRGRVLDRGINRIVLDVNGVGYDVAVSLSCLEAVPADGGEMFLHIHTALRENALELYGFTTPDEKRLFEMLITVAGIGPRTSLVILSGISPDGLRRAVVDGNVSKLTTVPGIGKKSAERIILELREKLKKSLNAQASAVAGQTGPDLEEDLVSSLLNLGYKERAARDSATKVLKQTGPDVPLPQAVKMALKELMR